jgi:hypothetical protein
MSKLHELLAVEGDLHGIAKKMMDETIKTFGKPEHFQGYHKHLEMFNEEEQGKVVADEYKEMVTTVPDKLEYLGKSVANYFDAVLQKEATNQNAKADLVIDGVVIGTDVPATFLLGLENKMKELRNVLEAAPTLPPGNAWEKDETLGNGVYRLVNPVVTMKTAKQIQHKVLYQATDKHPAQIEKWDEQVNVGKYITNVQNGMLSPADKSRILGKCDKLIQAVKKARMQANNTDVVSATIGEKIFDFIVR